MNIYHKYKKTSINNVLAMEVNNRNKYQQLLNSSSKGREVTDYETLSDFTKKVSLYFRNGLLTSYLAIQGGPGEMENV